MREQNERTDYQQEEGYLQEVIAFADQKMEGIASRREALKQEAMEQAKVMHDELAQMIVDFDDIIRLSVENDAMSRVQKQYEDNEAEYRRLEAIKESPYFARIDFVDREFGEENTVYIGARGLSDNKNYRMYVCDWRAPVCELFYGFDRGEAWYETARGRVEVLLERKRQIRICDSQLKDVYDSDASAYDEILGKVLAGHKESRLKVIVDSIQKEQNRAIRFTGSRNVLIHGPAGSGKTSVGMHRLAYLLYEQKDSLQADDMVILSNNQIFSDYVAGILPQLGEEDVTHMIFGELLESLLPGEILCEDFYEQYRAIEADSRRKSMVALKYSCEMIRLIERYFEEYHLEIPDLYYEEEIILTGEELNERIRRRIADQKGKGIRETYRQRLAFLVELVKKTYENYFLEHQERISREIAETERDEDGDKLEGKALLTRYKIRRREIVTEAVDTIRAWNELDSFAHCYRILEQFAQMQISGVGGSEGEDRDVQLDAAQQLQRDWNAGKLKFEDALLYVIIGLYTGEIAVNSQVRHVLIDELQDYGTLQLYLIQLLYPRGAFTLLADCSQAVSDVVSLQSVSRLETIWNMVSEEPLDKLTLARSYRSSAPINAFAFRYLEQFDPACAANYTYFQRAGKEPLAITADHPVEKVTELLQQLSEEYQVGILTIDEADATTLYESIQTPEMQLLADPQDTIQKKRLVMPLLLAKGLEFDAVLLYRFRDRLHRDDSYARKMYLGCTRALHELYLIDAR